MEIAELGEDKYIMLIIFHVNISLFCLQRR